MIKCFLYTVRVAIIVAGAFLFASRAVASTTSIIITEIGAYEPGGQEWVEIYNNGSAPIDMTDWTFWENDTNHGLSLVQGDDTILDPGEYAVITQNNETFVAAYPNVSVTLFDSSWGSLKESGEEIGLKDATGEFIEQFTYVAAPTFSLERVNYDLVDYTATNWQEHGDSNTVGVANSNHTTQPTPIATTEAQIRINEFVSNQADGEHEWIELYNMSSNEADLTGWTIEDGVGTIVTLDQTISASGYVVIELSSSKLNNGGDEIVLKDVAGEMVNHVTYGNWDDGDVSDNIPAPAKGESVSYSTNSFVVTAHPTKGAANQPPVETPEDNTPNITAPLASRSIEASTIVINEFVSDPADGKVEFVELYNRSTQEIDLTGWWMQDGGESKTDLSGIILPQGFVVVEKPKGNLNNEGDQLTLFEPTGLIIDHVTYGSWNDGGVYNNAPAANDPNSVARKEDGYDTDIDANDFLETNIVTPGAPNTFPAPLREDEQVAALDTDVIISELFPNPVGSDSEGEFIELKNNGSQPVDLSGWQLGDSSSKRFTIRDVVLVSHAFITFFRSDTDIALNNTGGDSVTLLSANKDVVDHVQYDDRAEEGFVFARSTSGEWQWSTAQTPNKDNIIQVPNSAPVPKFDVADVASVGEPIVFDASDSFDAQGDIVAYTWDFGDGDMQQGVFVTHTYKYADNVTVTLTVTDESGEMSELQKEIEVQPRYIADHSYDMGVRISEFLPNPVGSDSAEFIELVNITDQSADISGLLLDDEDGGSYPYVIPPHTVFSPGELYVFEKAKTGLSLNNTQDQVRLLYPNKEVVDEVSYDAVVEGASYAMHDDKWLWTSTLTPGEVNIITQPELKKKSTSSRAVAARSAKTKSIVHTTLASIHDFDPGDRVSVTGTVAVLPGVFGSQYFYLAGNGGVQVYQNKKDFPVLTLGDGVFVSGELSQAYGEYRLKLASKNDITVLSSGNSVTPRAVDIVEIGEAFEGQLVSISGELTEVKSSYMYVDDGSEEIKIYIKKGTGITKDAYHVGQTVSVIGVVSERSGVYQLLPRSAEDIVIQEDGATVDTVATSTQEKNVAETYLTATAGGLTSILIGLAARARGALAIGFVRRVGSSALGTIRRGRG